MEQSRSVPGSVSLLEEVIGHGSWLVARIAEAFTNDPDNDR